MTLRVSAGLVCMFVALEAAPAFAQDWSALRRDPAVQNYPLSMDKVRKLVDVQRALSAVAASDPQAMPAIDREFKEVMKGNAQPTVADAAAVIERHPNVRDAITKSGGSTRDWLLTFSAANIAAVDLLTRQYKKDAPSAARTPAEQANVALLEKNQAEWQKIQLEMRQMAAASAPKAKE